MVGNQPHGSGVYKIVVLGEGGVGKSALTLQFVSHSFSDNLDPTIEDAYQKQAVIDGEPAHLDILDTAGQIEFTAMREQYMRCGEGFLICFSITDRRSFDEVLQYRTQILKVRAAELIPIVLVANKADLTEKRQVSSEEAQSLASNIGCPYFETSAVLRHHVDECFHSLVREIRFKRTNRRPGKLSSRSSRRPWDRIRGLILWLFTKRRRKI